MTARGKRLARIREASNHIESMLKALFDGDANRLVHPPVRFSTSEIMNIRQSVNYLVRLARKAKG